MLCIVLGIHIPDAPMYRIFTHTFTMNFSQNVGEYCIYGASGYGLYKPSRFAPRKPGGVFRRRFSGSVLLVLDGTRWAPTIVINGVMWPL